MWSFSIESRITAAFDTAYNITCVICSCTGARAFRTKRVSFKDSVILKNKWFFLLNEHGDLSSLFHVF